ncbi:MAG TPA: hypothetical protein VGB54_14630 [Allosphingosinicella sp.]|jgi:hypothetical protein
MGHPAGCTGAGLAIFGVRAVSDYLPFLVFLYGAFAGFLMFRLGRNNQLRAGEERVLVAAGWAMTALSLTLAAALIVFAISQSLFPLA